VGWGGGWGPEGKGRKGAVEETLVVVVVAVTVALFKQIRASSSSLRICVAVNCIAFCCNFFVLVVAHLCCCICCCCWRYEESIDYLYHNYSYYYFTLSLHVAPNPHSCCLMFPCLFVHLTTTVGPLVGCKIFKASMGVIFFISNSSSMLSCDYC